MRDDHMRARQAERRRRLAQLFGTSVSMSSVVRTTTGIDEHRERHRAGTAREVAHRRHHDLVDEQADDDRGRAQQDVVDEPHDLRQPAVAAVLGQVGAGQDADRRADQRSPSNGHDQAADDRVQQAAAGTRRRRIWVNRSRERPPRPLYSSDPEDQDQHSPARTRSAATARAP